MKGIRAILGAALIILPLFSYGQQPSPLIIVNGMPTELTDLRQIEPQDIEHIDTEAVDEAAIEKYGMRANNGILHVTLRYDEAARFEGGGTFDDYIASRVRWDSSEAAARVVVRYTIGEQGRITVGEVLQATDKRLKRRVMKALKEPSATAMWSPAKRRGTPVATERVLHIQLPEGKSLPREPYIILL